MLTAIKKDNDKKCELMSRSESARSTGIPSDSYLNVTTTMVLVLSLGT